MTITDIPRRDIFDAMDDAEREFGFEARRLCAAPDVADKHRALFVQKLSGDPLIQRYLSRQFPTGVSDRRGSPPITEPWMALGEQKAWALAMASTALPVAFFDGRPDEPETIKRMRVTAALLMSQTFLWSKSVFKTVQACPMPQHVIARDILPFPFTYHSTEVGFDVSVPTGITNEATLRASLDTLGEATCDWFTVTDVPNQHGSTVTTSASSFGAGVAPRAVIVQSDLPYGKTFPDDFPAAARPAVNLILSMFAFLKSPYVDIDYRKLPRPMRRHNGVTQEDVDKVIGVVQLRQAAKNAIDAYNAESPAWRHRWWVRGHYRRQWHASSQSHEVIWIAPFIKGPEAAPMLQKVYAVNR